MKEASPVSQELSNEELSTQSKRVIDGFLAILKAKPKYPDPGEGNITVQIPGQDTIAKLTRFPHQISLEFERSVFKGSHVDWEKVTVEHLREDCAWAGVGGRFQWEGEYRVPTHAHPRSTQNDHASVSKADEFLDLM